MLYLELKPDQRSNIMKKLWKRFLIVYLLLWGLSAAKAQSDTLFWFAVPHIQQVGVLSNTPFKFHFENGSTDTAVVVLDVPANPTFTAITVAVPPRNRSSIDITANMALLANQSPNTPQNRGVRVRSSRVVQAYYEVGSATCGCNQEYFGLKGRNGLGTLFYVAFRDIWANDSTLGISPVTSVDMVAVENGTQITIQSPVALLGIAAGAVVNVNLQAGQTYSLRAIDWRLINKPNGLKLTSTKPIAITLKDEQVRAGACADLTGDQIVPVTNLKTTYPVLKGNLMVPDLVTVLAVYDNTRIVFEGSAQPDLLLNAGEFRSILVNVAAHTIRSNKPLYAVHYSGIGCSVGMSVLNGIGCKLDSVYGFIRENEQPLIFNFIIPVGYQDSIRINEGPPGNVVGGVHFSPLPGSLNPYLWAVFELHQSIIGAGMPVRISAPVGFSVGIRHGNPSSGMRYTTFGDFTGDPFFDIQTDTAICLGDTVRLTATHDGIWQPLWQLPNGQLFNGDTLFIPGFGPSNQGWYRFQLLDGSCLSRIDSIWLALTPNQVGVELFPPARDTICAGDTLVLRARLVAGTGLQWHNEQGPIPLAFADSLVVSTTGTYYAIATAPCTLPDTSSYFSLFVDSLLPIQFSLIDSLLCAGDSVLFVHSSGFARGRVKMKWPNGSIQALATNDSIWLTNPGRYALWYETSTCTFDSSYFNVFEAPIPPTLQGFNLLRCESGDATLWWPGQGSSFLWFKDGLPLPGFSDSVLRVDENGTYSLAVVANYKCYPDTLWLDSLVVYRSKAVAHLQASTLGGPKPLTVNFGSLGALGHQRQWFVNGVPLTTDSIWQWEFTQRGRYTVRLEMRDTLARCIDDTTVLISVFDSIAVLFPTAFSPNGDGKNDHYLPVLINADFVDLSIYNVWGELVFSSSGQAPGWDGRFKTQPAAPGRYVCVVRFRGEVGDMGMKSSSFLLIR